MSSISQPTSRSRNLAIGMAVPAVVGLATWLVIVSVAGVDLAARTGDTTQTIGWPAVLVVSLLAALAGWALLAVLRRVVSRPRRVWTIVAVAALVVSLAGPPAGVDPASQWSLALLHLLVGGSIIAVLRRSTTDRPNG